MGRFYRRKNLKARNLTLPILTATEKQPKPKNQTPPQPKDGMGTLLEHPILAKRTEEILLVISP